MKFSQKLEKIIDKRAKIGYNKTNGRCLPWFWEKSHGDF